MVSKRAYDSEKGKLYTALRGTPRDDYSIQMAVWAFAHRSYVSILNRAQMTASAAFVLAGGIGYGTAHALRAPELVSAASMSLAACAGFIATFAPAEKRMLRDLVRRVERDNPPRDMIAVAPGTNIKMEEIKGESAPSKSVTSVFVHTIRRY